MRIFDFLFPVRVDESIVRIISDDDFLALVNPRLVSGQTLTLLPFHEEMVRAALHEAKYHGAERAFELLGRALAHYLQDCDEIAQGLTLVPIPLGAERYKKRGFNQVYEIVKRAVRTLDKETRIHIDTSLLTRTRETPSQVSLPRHEREENMRSAFSVAHSVNPAHTYVIVDDVITTGATLQAAVDALKKAGANHIIPLALAH